MKQNPMLVFPGLLLLVLLTGCTHMLEKNEIADLRTVFRSEDGREFLEVSGTPVHSALVISAMSVESRGATLHLNMKLELVRKGLSGLPLYLKIPLPNSVRQVTIGDREDVLWTRSSGEKEPE
jgi:hypothetical protein